MLNYVFTFFKKMIVKHHIAKHADMYGGSMAIFSLDKPDKNITYRHLLSKIIDECNGVLMPASGYYDGQEEKSYVLYFNASLYLRELIKVLKEADQDSFILYSSKTDVVNLISLKGETEMLSTHWCTLSDITTDVENQIGYITFPVAGSKLMRELKFSFIFVPSVRSSYSKDELMMDAVN